MGRTPLSAVNSTGKVGGRRDDRRRGKVLLALMSVALVAGTTVVGAVGTTAVAEASANTAVTTNTLQCWAETSKLTQAASSSITYKTNSTPPSVVPGGTFTDTFAPSGVATVPPKTGTYAIDYFGTTTARLALPAGVTVVAGPTITVPGYYYKATQPTAHTPLTATVTLVTDGNAPGGKIVKESDSTHIPGGDDYVPPTFTVGLKVATSPPSSKVAIGLVTVPPAAGSHVSADPGYGAKITVTAGSLGGKLLVTLNCWPSPKPQPPFVTTSIIDNVPPAVTIATPGATSQVVVGSSVHASFTCVDPPPFGDGIKTCTATNTGNPISNGSAITTSVLGGHTVTVTSENNSTFTKTVTNTYKVIQPPYNLVPPEVTITSPQNGAQFVTGSSVTAKYSCAANLGTSLASCQGTVATGATISTTAGYHTFTVKALDHRGNPTTVTVGYYARTSTKNAKVSTVSSDEAVPSTWSSSNYSCTMGESFAKEGITIINETPTFTKAACVFGTSHDPEATWKITTPSAKGGQIAVGDRLTVVEQIYRPGAHAADTATKGGYDSGAYKQTVTVTAPSGTTITGPITTAKTGLTSSTFGGTASARLASACNYNGSGAVGTGSGKFCSTATAPTTLQKLLGTAGPGGSDYQGFSTYLGTTITITTLAGGSLKLAATARSAYFDATGGTLVAVTSTGTASLTFTGVSGSTLTGVHYRGGARGTLKRGADIAEPTNTPIHGAAKVNGSSVSGWTWSVTATNQSTFNVTWNGSSCENNTGNPHPLGTKTKSRTYEQCLTTTPSTTTRSYTTKTRKISPYGQPHYGIDGDYIYLAYKVKVTNAGAISIPGLGSIEAAQKDNNTEITGIDTLLGGIPAYGSSVFTTTATAAPGITFTSVDPNPPTATLAAPSQGAIYGFGQAIDASYACSDPTAGTTIVSCVGVETTGTANQRSVANGGALTTSALVPNEIHTFTVTATNTEGYVSKSYATFVTLASPPVLATQSAAVTSGSSVTIPFDYSGTYPATLATERITSAPSHGTAVIDSTGSITYTNNNTPFASDSFKYSVSDAAGNPSNTAVVTLDVSTTIPPTIAVTTPTTPSGSVYPRKQVVDATYTCADNVQVASCSASQTVTGFHTSVPDHGALDTSSLIIGGVHHLKVVAVDWAGNTTTKTVSYVVTTPHPVAASFTVSTGDHKITVNALAHVTSTYPITARSLKVVTQPHNGTATVTTTHVIVYTPTVATSGVVIHDSFTYEVKDVDGQLSNKGTVRVNLYPVPTITSLSRTSGPTSGGTGVTITGTGFATVASVKFGTTAAKSFTVTSSTQIAATSPAHTAGRVRISVTTPGGTTTATTADLYSFVAAQPTVSSISPTNGPPAGGSTVTVSGTGFTGATKVFFGTSSVSPATINGGGTQLTAKSPSGTPGTQVNVEVTTPGGRSAAVTSSRISRPSRPSRGHQGPRPAAPK
jgi:hypothetical protein